MHTRSWLLMWHHGLVIALRIVKDVIISRCQLRLSGHDGTESVEEVRRTVTWEILNRNRMSGNKQGKTTILEQLNLWLWRREL